MEKGSKGRMTFRIAAAFFVAAGAVQIAAVGTAVPLLGVFRGGAAAVAYHLVFFVLYAALGVGLWLPRRWGYGLVFAAAGLATLDTVQLLWGMDAVTGRLALLMAQHGAGAAADERLLGIAAASALLSMAAGWWGFAAYTYLRRAYFRKGSGSSP